jgi:hypothetical protein
MRYGMGFKIDYVFSASFGKHKYLNVFVFMRLRGVVAIALFELHHFNVVGMVLLSYFVCGYFFDALKIVFLGIGVPSRASGLVEVGSQSLTLGYS